MQYIAQLFLGRALSQEAFGIFNSINSLSVFVSSLTIAVSFAAAQELIKLGYNHELHILFVKELIKKTLYMGLTVSIIITFISQAIANYLALDSVLPVMIYIMIICGILAQSIFTGMLQGLSRYTAMSIGQAIQMGGRLIFIVIAVAMFSLSYNGALFGMFLSYVVAIGFYLYYLSDFIFVPLPSVKLPKGLFRNMLVGAVPMALIWLYLGIVSNMDIPLVKHFSSSYDAGIYSGGAIVGRIVWFFTAALAYVLFPEVVRGEASGKSSAARTFFITMIIFVISLTLAGVFSLFPELILTILLGSKYTEAKQALVIVSFSMVILAMLSVLYNYCLAKKFTFVIYPAYAIFIGCVMLIYYGYHSRPIEIAYVFLFGLALTFIINVGQFVVKFRTEIAYHVTNIRQGEKSLWRV